MRKKREREIKREKRDILKKRKREIKREREIYNFLSPKTVNSIFLKPMTTSKHYGRQGC